MLWLKMNPKTDTKSNKEYLKQREILYSRSKETVQKQIESLSPFQAILYKMFIKRNERILQKLQKKETSCLKNLMLKNVNTF